MENIFAIVLTLFFAIDSFGMIPIYLHLMHNVSSKKKRQITLRELFFALVLMIVFIFLGEGLLVLLSLSRTTVTIAGGVILFFIAIKLIFGHSEEKHKIWKPGAIFIVPIASPLIAGPSVLAVIMIFSQTPLLSLIKAIFIAWFFSSIIILFADSVYKMLGDRGLLAIERLMGLIVALISVQTILSGIKLITAL